MKQKPSASQISYFLTRYGLPPEVAVEEVEITDGRGTHIAMMFVFTFPSNDEVSICTWTSENETETA